MNLTFRMFQNTSSEVNRPVEDVCWSIRNVKFINESFYNMRCLVMFITAVYLIFSISADEKK